MNQEQLQAIRELVNKASVGPWSIDYPWYNENAPLMIVDVNGEIVVSEGFEPDASFIAHAREDVPALLNYADSLIKENERLRGALEAVTYPVNNLSSPDALEYHADVCKTVEEALAGELT